MASAENEARFPSLGMVISSSGMVGTAEEKRFQDMFVCWLLTLSKREDFRVDVCVLVVYAVEERRFQG